MSVRSKEFREPELSPALGEARGPAAYFVENYGQQTGDVLSRMKVLRRVAAGLGVLTIALAVTTLVGWAFDLRSLTHIPPQGQPMVPWTAVCVILLSLAVIARVNAGLRWIRYLAGTLTVGVSGTMLVEIVLGRSSGFDRVMFGSSLRAEIVNVPGQMAPNTTIALILLATGLLTVGLHGRLAWVSVTTSLLASAIGMIALLGYATGRQELYEVGTLTKMACPTAISLFVLGAAVILVGAPDGPVRLFISDGPGGRVARWLLPSAGLLPLVVGLLEQGGHAVGLYSDVWVPIVLLAGLAMVVAPLAWLLASRLDLAYRERLTADAIRSHLATIVDSSTDAIMSVDLEHKVMTWNAGAEKMFGYPAEEVLGKDVTVLAVPGAEQDIPRKLEYVLSGGRIEGVQTTRRAKDGRIIDVSLSVSPLRNARGEVVGAAAIFHDISTQRRADAQFRELVEAAPDALVITDQHGLIRIVNEQTERLLGFDRHELLGSPVEVLLPVPLRSRHLDHRRGYSRSPHRRPMGEGLELNARHKDGTLIPVEISLAPLDTVEGTFVSAAVRDVRQRRQSEAARREAEQRFRRVFEDSPLGMAVVDRDLRVIEANEALGNLTGLPVSAIEGQPLTYLVPADDGGELIERASEILRPDGTVHRFEQRLQRLHGDPVWTSVTATAMGEGTNDHDGVLIFEDITDRRTFEGRLQYLADHDALTGLFNRRRFEEELDRERHSAQRYGGSGALLLLDLDHFKYVNDSLGHAAGDELLRQVAATLRSHVRMTDIVGRLGGDEFAIVLPRSDRVAAAHVAESLLRALRAEVRMSNDRVQGATASVGIASFGGSEDVASEELFIQADIAMYDAKDAGRNTYRFYDADDVRRRLMFGRLTWGERMRHALEHDGFVLLAQPIIDLNGTDPRPRSELLIRMRGEDGELITPDAFLYLTERFGLTEEVDAWVVNRAIDMLQAESVAGRPTLFEVNLSARALESDRISTLVRRRIAETGVDPSSLCFEITETAAITNVERARTFAQDLRTLGCRFALDDFGAGFASFYYLKHLVFDYLKIDGEFVKGIVHNEVDQLLVKSLVQVARGLGKRTIAEYVEDDATLEMLRDFGVDFAQGYRVGRPTSVETAWRQVANGGWETSEGLVSNQRTTSPPARFGEVVDINARRRV